MNLTNYQVIQGRKLRVGLVGCGRIAKSHFGSIKQYIEDLELVAVCDVDREALSQAKAEHDVPGYDDLDEMLSNEKLDLVVLCTPSGLHPSQAILAARHGVNVVSEKPMATRYKDGLKMVQACDQARVRLFIVKQNRRNPTLQLLKRAVEEKRFGAIKMVNINVFWTRPQDYYDQGQGWRGTWEFDGGAFMNQASHYVDLMEWLIGPVDRLQAMLSTTRDIEAEDSGVLNIKWRNGALGSMAVTMLTYPNNLEGSITILGETGSVKVGGIAVNEIQTWKFADKRDYDDEVFSANYATTSVYGFGHPLYYRNVIDVMRGLVEPETDGREGLKSLELITAAYMAARDSTTIGLPLEL
jgi:UDP-N-acetyl-2-amino-2-deoxyglucuronate dehydrogenase